MKYSQAKQGRVFVVRLEDGDVLHASLEKLAEKEGVERAYVQVVGGADKGSILITGPEHGRADKIIPMTKELDEMHEIVGNGTIFPDINGKPKLHLHIACGRKEQTICGEIREGVKVWHIVEVIIVELLENKSLRLLDRELDLQLLNANVK